MSDVHSTGAPCIGQNPTCPCQDGDACHYEDTPTTKGWPVPDDQTGALRQQPEAVDHERSLLELAAIAYWGDEIDDVCSIRWLEDDRAIGYTHGDNQDHNGIDQEFLWNPLEDDGDALRLAVRLGLTVSASSLACTASHLKLWHVISEPGAADIYAATRRAIVRAAAAIGIGLLKAASGSHQEARSNEQGCAACATCGKPWGEST